MMISYHEQLSKSAQFIRSNDNFLIVSHIHPDGDTISSSIAMALILKTFGKTFQLVNDTPVPDKLDFLPLSGEICLASEIKAKFSNIITIDAADYYRIGTIDHLMDENRSLLNIDHHPTNDYFGDVNLVLPTASATAEIMYDLANEMNIPMDRDLAICIYTGIFTDTGGFRYSNTTPKVMRTAAELLEFNISPSDIASATLESITKAHIHILKKALSNLEIDENGTIAWTTLKHIDLLNVSATSDDTEGIVNYARNIEGIEVGILFKEIHNEEIKVSLRSNKFLDVGAIAKSFGGGGHGKAAGFTYHGPLDNAQKELLIKIKQSKGWNKLER